MLEAVIASFMIWISAHTGFVIPEPPDFSKRTEREIWNMVYSCDKNPKSNPCREPRGEAGIVAIYNNRLKEIMVPMWFDLDKLSHRSILLHELVHHLQYENEYDEEVMCKAELEKQAYDLQDLWLKENKAVLSKGLEIGPLLRYTVTTCDEMQGWGALPD